MAQSPTPKNKANKSVVTGSTIPRPPVVVVMGHIDHGKSTLLDFIRKANVVAGEAGGITQHLGAYEVHHTTAEGKAGVITFLDTPGHEAFCDIRTRGSQVADIAVLVVSAEDGVKPQTLEALSCIKAEELPYVVAINKIDKPGANIERTKQNLAEHEIYVEGYGGDIPVVPISALTGQGVPELLDMLILVAELENLSGDPTAVASGAVIEGSLHPKKGISASLLIKNGTLRVGTFVVAHDAISPVRILEDHLGKAVKEATFSSPVKVIGWDKLPLAGTPFIVVENKKEAEEIAAKNAQQNPITTDNTVYAEGTIVIPIIIKADVVGSLEGIQFELKKIKHDKVKIKIIAAGIGEISERDVKVAQSTPDTILIAFNVKPDAKAKSLLERTPINVQSFNVIYNITEYLQKLATSKIPKEYIDQSIGKAKILQVFSKNKDKQIVGGKVQEGEIRLGGEVKILRRDIEIGRGRIKELQQQKVKAQEVREGYEFGTLIESKIEIAQGDKVECFETVEK
ncbi:MAG: translation initiation factor IF-2 [Candidatus Taylorbacteria bacterium]|nr:translation initiation factor IF-2 [Candidatus Taylorbacteria bacterium]